jgi:hypothetical protein
VSEWAKREDTETEALRHYTDIWDSEGWQINLSVEGRYSLIDAEMPMMPMSPVMGSFDTFEEACARAAELGKPNWSDFPE